MSGSDKVATFLFFFAVELSAVDPGLTFKFRGVNKVLKPVVKPQCEEEGSSNDHLKWLWGGNKKNRKLHISSF